MHNTGGGGVVRPGVHVQHFLHARGKFGVGLGRNDPVLDLPLRHLVFFSVRRTVSWLTASTISNATARSASRRRVQLAKPFGGGPSRRAMILASSSPSRTLPRMRLLGLPWSATSNPSVTKRSRRLSTDRVRQSNASAIWASVQFGPSASAFS